MCQCSVCVFNARVYTCICRHNYINLFSTVSFAEALFEKKQANLTYENEVAKLQAQVGNLEAISAEKDALNSKYKAILKECKGKDIS